MNADYLSTRRTRKKELGRLGYISQCRALAVNGKPLDVVERPGDSRDAQVDAGVRRELTFWNILPSTVDIEKKLDKEGSTKEVNWILLWTIAFLAFVIFASQFYPTVSVWAGGAFIVWLVAIGIISRRLRDIITVRGYWTPDDRYFDEDDKDNWPAIAEDFMAQRYGIAAMHPADYVSVQLSVPRWDAGDLVENIHKAASENWQTKARQIDAQEMNRWEAVYRPDNIASVRVRASSLRYILQLAALPAIFAVTLAFLAWGVPWIVDRWDMANAAAAFIRGMIWPAQLLIVGLLIAIPWMGVVRVWRWIIGTSYQDEDNRARWRHRTDYQVQVLPAGTTKWVHVHSSTSYDSARELHRLIAADIRASGKRFD